MMSCLHAQNVVIVALRVLVACLALVTVATVNIELVSCRLVSSIVIGVVNALRRRMFRLQSQLTHTQYFLGNLSCQRR